MSQPIATWLKDILPHTPGCSRAVAKRTFLTMCREFFRLTTVWREEILNLDVVAATGTYALIPVDLTSQVSQVLAVQYRGLPLSPLAGKPPGGPSSGTPTGWYLGPGMNQITLWPTPDQSEVGALSAIVALNILPTATDLPDIAYVHHYDTLLDGVLGKLFSHPAKPYSNPALAQYHLRRFQSGVGVAAGLAKQGNIKTQNWVFPSYDK